MPLESVHHIAIIASDLERSLMFYQDVLGCVEIERIDRPERGSSIIYLEVCNNTLIELFSFPEPPKRLTYPEATGLRHIAFCVEDFDSALDGFAEKGARMSDVHIDPRTHLRATFIFDPDELPIEIMEKRL